MEGNINEIIQTIGVAIIVMSAIVYLLVKIFRKPKKEQKGGCCCGCSLSQTCQTEKAKEWRDGKGRK